MLKDAERDELLRGLKLAGAGVAVLALTVWLTVAFAGLRANKDRLRRLEPMLTEARALDAGFDQVAAEPGKYTGKYAAWCVQNIGGGRVFYKGDMNRVLRVFNYEQMPAYVSYGGQNCNDMLLQLRYARKLSTGGSVVDVVYVAPL